MEYLKRRMLGNSGQRATAGDLYKTIGRVLDAQYPFPGVGGDMQHHEFFQPSRISSKTIFGVITGVNTMEGALAAMNSSVMPPGATLEEVMLGRLPTSGPLGECLGLDSSAPMYAFLAVWNKKLDRRNSAGSPLVYNPAAATVRLVQPYKNALDATGHWLQFLTQKSDELWQNIEAVQHLSWQAKLHQSEKVAENTSPELEDASPELEGDDFTLAKATSLLDYTAHSEADFVAAAMRYCMQYPKFWQRQQRLLRSSWSSMWHQHQEALRPRPPLGDADFDPYVPGGYQDALTQEIGMAHPHKRRMYYIWGDKGVGKSLLQDQSSCEHWWPEHNMVNPGFMDITAIKSMHHFVPIYQNQRFLACNFEGDAVKHLSAQQNQFLLDLTDQCLRTSGKCTGKTARVAAHVVIFANEPPPKVWLHKEVWLLKLHGGAHRRNTTEWEFPGEAPTTKAFLGRCVSISNPWPRGTGDERVEQHAKLGDDWLTQSAKIYTIADIPDDGARDALQALDPDVKRALEKLLETASLEGVLPKRPRLAAPVLGPPAGGA